MKHSQRLRRPALHPLHRRLGHQAHLHPWAGRRGREGHICAGPGLCPRRQHGECGADQSDQQLGAVRCTWVGVGMSMRCKQGRQAQRSEEGKNWQQGLEAARSARPPPPIPAPARRTPALLPCSDCKRARARRGAGRGAGQRHLCEGHAGAERPPRGAQHHAALPADHCPAEGLHTARPGGLVGRYQPAVCVACRAGHGVGCTLAPRPDHPSLFTPALCRWPTQAMTSGWTCICKCWLAPCPGLWVGCSVRRLARCRTTQSGKQFCGTKNVLACLYIPYSACSPLPWTLQASVTGRPRLPLQPAWGQPRPWPWQRRRWRLARRALRLSSQCEA